MVYNSWKWQREAERWQDEGTGIIRGGAALFRDPALIRKNCNLPPVKQKLSHSVSGERCALPSPEGRRKANSTDPEQILLPAAWPCCLQSKHAGVNGACASMARRFLILPGNSHHTHIGQAIWDSSELSSTAICAWCTRLRYKLLELEAILEWQMSHSHHVLHLMKQ